MADTKITALQTPGAYPVVPSTDVLPIVITADNSMAASGSTRKVTVNQLLGAGGTATLASATISGAANFNGGATAAYLNGGLLVGSSGNYVNIYGQSNGLIVKDSTGVQNLFSIATAGVFTFGDGAGGTRMILNSTGLGIGTTVLGGNKLAIGSTSDTSATANGFNIISNRATITTTCNGAVDAAGTTINYSWANGGQGPLIFRNNLISNVMTLDASGNCGIGVTPSSNRLQIAGNIGLPNTCTASGETSGVFSIDVANLVSVSGGLNVRRAAILMTYVGVDGAGTNPTTLQTLIVLEGFNTWATISKNDIVGTASVAVSGATATSATVTVTVPTGNAGTVHCTLLGGPGATTRPSMTINP